MKFENLRKSTMLKLVITGFLTLVLLVPLAMVSGLVRERSIRRDNAINEVSKKWGNKQYVCGPVLTIPYKSYYRDEKNIIRMKKHKAYFLPDSLKINGKINTEKRSRGIYEVVLYRVDDLIISGKFAFPDFKKLQISKENILWDEAFLTVGIPDTRGIKKEIVLNWNKTRLKFDPGVNGVNLYRSGIHTYIKNLKKLKGKNINFNLKMDLQGSSSISFAPFGKETLIELESPWQHPSFFGAYLPNNREITEDGFRASWKISYFGRNFPQEWKGNNSPNANEITRSSSGVALYMPVDFYQKCERAVKYGFLFIALTFTIFFLFEILNKLNIHPLQYLMIGFALCVFYLLFLSLSEHMNFLISYLLSSLGVIGLITGYSIKVLKTRARTSIMSGLLFSLYGYLFILLQNQDYALLIGSLGLFFILGAVMYITRNIDWYNIRLGNDMLKDDSKSYSS